MSITTSTIEERLLLDIVKQACRDFSSSEESFNDLWKYYKNDYTRAIKEVLDREDS